MRVQFLDWLDCLGTHYLWAYSLTLFHTFWPFQVDFLVLIDSTFSHRLHLSLLRTLLRILASNQRGILHGTLLLYLNLSWVIVIGKGRFICMLIAWFLLLLLEGGPAQDLEHAGHGLSRDGGQSASSVDLLCHLLRLEFIMFNWNNFP